MPSADAISKTFHLIIVWPKLEKRSNDLLRLVFSHVNEPFFQLKNNYWIIIFSPPKKSIWRISNILHKDDDELCTSMHFKIFFWLCFPVLPFQLTFQELMNFAGAVCNSICKIISYALLCCCQKCFGIFSL